jgi:voltage-gated sodium channel
MKKLTAFLESQRFQYFIITVIVINAVVLGLQTSAEITAEVGGLLTALDGIALVIFVAEIALKLVAYRHRFFTNPWNVFDFIIVGTALLPTSEGVSVLRALRILRAFRLVSSIQTMRNVIQALLNSIPAMGSVITIMGLIFYVFSVMSTSLFGEAFPQWFGSIGQSLYSLFQIMTLESWSMGIVRPVMEVYPYAWAVFVPFIIFTTFAVLNLFVAIIVNSMQKAAHEEIDEHGEKHFRSIMAELKCLRSEIEGMKEPKK